MRYLLDTNVISELRKRDSSTAVQSWISRQNPTELAISVITILEIEIGIRRVALRDPVQARALRDWQQSKVLTGFRDRIIGIDVDVALRVAEFHVPDKAPQHDDLIAGTAAARGLVVVTRNVEDFRRTGVGVLNPWDAATRTD